MKYRESELPGVPPGRGDQVSDGRRYISVVGIDRYKHWGRLNNAVNDARGVQAAFARFGFETITAPLFDGAATRDALHQLPSVLKQKIGGNDSLVVFFAGHGHTTSNPFADGYDVVKGYLIPADAEQPQGEPRTWQRLDGWLTELAELPARHILVILDSCRSGIALSRSIQYRAAGARTDGSSVPSDQRRSRLVITSAAADQPAMDGGPFTGHSVFTGYLIETLRGGPPFGGSQVGMRLVAAYVRDRVFQHSRKLQLPDIGPLEFDDAGELRVSLEQPGNPASRDEANDGLPKPGRSGDRVVRRDRSPARNPAAQTPLKTGSLDLGPARELPGHTFANTPLEPASLGNPSATPAVPATAATSTFPRTELHGLPSRTEGWVLDRSLAAALDRHGEERRRGAQVLTVVAGDAMAAQTSWGTWAAQHGYLTLATESVDLDAVVADLLAQTPWLRCVPEARKRLAAAAEIDVQAVDASLDARSGADRRTWIDDVGGGDRHVRVSGWLLSWLRHPKAGVPDLATAKVPPHELLSIACDLASPTAVLLFNPKPDERWLERAIATAAALTSCLPRHSVAVTAPHELVSRVLDARRSGAAWTMARQGRVDVASLAQRLPGRSRDSTLRVLFDALARDPRTRGRFELDGTVVSADGRPIDAGLVAHADRIAVELDAWYHFHDPERYRRDRIQDVRLARAGYFVLRFPAEDVDDRLASTIDQLAIALAGRRAARALF